VKRAVLSAVAIALVGDFYFDGIDFGLYRTDSGATFYAGRLFTAGQDGHTFQVGPPTYGPLNGTLLHFVSATP
jgi:hypothetical protein